MIPTFASPGVITPGQFGPIIRQPASVTAFLTRASSSAGMPSVMQTISGILASAASKAVGLKVPLVVRLEGTNVEKGREILEKSGIAIQTAVGLTDAAKKIVEAVS